MKFVSFSNSVFEDFSIILFSFHRVDHLYTFFVQWSPEVYGKDAKEQGFVVVEKDELAMVDDFFSEPSTKSWEVSAFCFQIRSLSCCGNTSHLATMTSFTSFLPHQGLMGQHT